MRKLIKTLFFIVILTLPYSAFALLSMELTRGVAGAIPIAIVPFAATQAGGQQDISTIVTNDLQNSGRFKVFGSNVLSVFPSDASAVKADYFRRLGTDNVVVGKVTALSGDRYQISFQLLDMQRGEGAASIVLDKKYTVPGSEFRKIAHYISDSIFEQMTGIRGVFSTKIAYVVVQRSDKAPARYILEVSDQDGYRPRPLLNSPEPIMSPSWSPSGKQLAYVSFEKRKAAIYLQEVATGTRRLLSQFPGINGAPAWSPDGQKLALVLSKSGSPNIYVLDVVTGGLTQITRDFYINTEPAWAPDGRTLLFTSNRSGGPQIYQVSANGGSVSRVSYDGDYNARASYTSDGKFVTLIHKTAGIYNIGILDLDTGNMRVLNSAAGDSASPSVAPNGGMILYDTVFGGRNVLAMVSSDGRVQVRLPARNGEAQDPAWSPFLS